MKLPTRVITYAWGDSYIDELLSVTIPALLAPNNLPSLASQVSCEVIILTEERLFARVNDNPAIRQLQKICPLRLIGLDDLITSSDGKYGMALTYALHRGFADLGAAMTDHWLIFLNADFVLADGSLGNLLDHLMRGKRLVASPSYCAVATDAKRELLERIDPKTGTLAVPPRDMAEIILRHRHDTIRSKTINQQAFHILYMEQFYWVVDDKTLLGRQMPVAIVGMRPESYVAEPNSYWDHGLMKEFCPTAEPDVIGDSDEFLMIELREKQVAQDQIHPGWPEARELSDRMISWVTPYQRDLAAYPLTLHAGDLPANIEDGYRALRTFVDEVLSYLPTHLPSHLEHPQWTYHWPGFMEARHHFLSSRLGRRTETMEPPADFSAIDRTWWKLDGRRKSLARQRLASAEAVEHVRKVLQNAVYEKDWQELDRQLLLEMERSTPALQSHDRGAVEHAAFNQDPSINLGKQSIPSTNWSDLLERYAEGYARVQERVQEKLEQALDAVNKHHLKRMHALDQELARIDAEYLLLIRKPATKLAPTYFLRMRRGPATPRTDSRRGLARPLVQKMYHRLFGKWPRVTKLSPYWAALRHLRQLSEAAVAREAKDMLILGERFGIPEAIVSVPGLCAWMSIPGLMTGGMGGTFAQPPQFDLCVCDLELRDLTRFSEIQNSARRFMRSGGTIIGFHFNIDAIQLPISDINELVANLRKIASVRIYYGGSERSSNVLKAFCSAFLPHRTRIVFLGKLAIKVGLLSARAWLGNTFDASFSEPHRPNPLATSVTIEIRLPKFDGDDDTVACAKADRIGIEQRRDEHQPLPPPTPNAAQCSNIARITPNPLA
jgi:hypothetical protein